MASNYPDMMYRPRIDHKLDAAANTDAVVTLTADADNMWVVDHISFAYDAAPTDGFIRISYGGTEVLAIPITSSGAGVMNLAGMCNAVKNEACVVTLDAGGAGVTGYLTVQYR